MACLTLLNTSGCYLVLVLGSSACLFLLPQEQPTQALGLGLGFRKNLRLGSVTGGFGCRCEVSWRPCAAGMKCYVGPCQRLLELAFQPCLGKQMIAYIPFHSPKVIWCLMVGVSQQPSDFRQTKSVNPFWAIAHFSNRVCLGCLWENVHLRFWYFFSKTSLGKERSKSYRIWKLSTMVDVTPLLMSA